MAVCPKCNFDNPDTANYCGNCSRELGRTGPPPTASQNTPVVLTDVQISFTRMVEITFKWTFAAMLVGFFLGIVVGFAYVVITFA